MQVFFNDNWRSFSTKKVLASSKYCSTNLSSLIIITKLSTHLMRRIDVFLGLAKERLMAFSFNTFHPFEVSHNGLLFGNYTLF